MDDVLAKPVDRERLDAMLERYAPPVGTRTGRHVVRPADRQLDDRTLAERPDLNPARFREVTMDDSVLARGLVGTFLESAENCLRDLEAALARLDLKAAGRAAHTLVGASANIGASRMEAVAAKMEEAAGRQDASALREMLPTLRARFKAATEALKGVASL